MSTLGSNYRVLQPEPQGSGISEETAQATFVELRGILPSPLLPHPQKLERTRPLKTMVWVWGREAVLVLVARSVLQGLISGGPDVPLTVWQAVTRRAMAGQGRMGCDLLTSTTSR